jgi:hypothetical protein
MFTQPDRIGQLAREHHHQLMADARQCRQHGRQAPSTPSAAARITRRLVAAFARASVVPAEAPGR